MVARSKMFVVSEIIDDSIKSLASSYDITIFKSFVEFEKYVNDVPVIIESLIISAHELPFNGVNMNRLMKVLNSKFLRITGNMTYLIDYNTKLDTVNQFIEMHDLTGWAVYQGDLGLKFVTDIITGAGRVSAEGQNEIITYRIRASEYIKQQSQVQYENDNAKYYTDEDLLADIPDEEMPNEINPASENDMIINYVVGSDGYERPLMVFFLAQYLALKEKVLIVEHDVEYHTLTEIATKSGLQFDMIYIDDVLDNISATIDRIRSSVYNLIVVGCKNRRLYDYVFIIDILQSNLKDNVQHIIRECNLDEIPYGKAYTVVMGNTVPEVLKCMQGISSEIIPEKVTFVGMQVNNLGQLNISTSEMKSIIEYIIGVNGVAAQVVKVNGVVLNGKEVVYDLLSIVNRGNSR